MKELAAGLLVLIIGGLYVLSEGLNKYQPVQPVAQPTAQVASVPTPRVVPTFAPAREVGVSGDILAVAQSWLGVRYRWGGCTRQGIDCSCFVQNVLRVFGIEAPRTTKPQSVWGTAVSRDDLQLGDLVLFNDTCTGCGPNPTHVGLAIGGGMMIHAGDPVQIAAISSFGSKYAGARRPPW